MNLTDFPPEEQFSRIMQFGLLHAVLQPIFRLHDGSVFGYEGLIRGPTGSLLHMPEQLFALAQRLGRRTDLEIAAARAVCRQFSAVRLPGTLLINLSCSAVEALADAPERTLEVLSRHELTPERIVVELTEHESVRDAAQFALSLRALRETGVGLALDDFGSGHSNLQLWMELRPRLVKLDRLFIHGLSASGGRFEIVRFMKGLADSFGTQLCAEGIEQESDLAVVHDMGIELAQGFLLGMPAAHPNRRMEAAAAAVLRQPGLPRTPVAPAAPRRLRLAGELSLYIPPIPEHTTNDELAEVLHRNASYHAVAVVRENKPVGVINRRGFMDRLAQPYYKEIYGRRSVTVFMNRDPVIVDWRTPLASLTRVLAGDDQRYLTDGFVITDSGQYRALGSGESLVRAVSEIRIEAARYANPLTFLPGSIPIGEHIDRLLASNAPFAACYADLNHFKPFNDQYGYWRGDEVIRLAASVIQDHTEPAADFVGHVGGDDFFILFQSADWRERCERIVAEFDERALGFFAPHEVAAGWFLGEDRKGLTCRFPLTTLAIGALPVAPGQYEEHEQVAALAAQAKRRAKAAGPSVYVLTEPEAVALAAE